MRGQANDKNGLYHAHVADFLTPICSIRQQGEAGAMPAANGRSFRPLWMEHSDAPQPLTGSYGTVLSELARYVQSNVTTTAYMGKIRGTYPDHRRRR